MQLHRFQSNCHDNFDDGWYSVSQIVKTIEEIGKSVSKIDVNFGKPIYLPGKVQLNIAEIDSEIEFEVITPEKGLIHLTGNTKS